MAEAEGRSKALFFAIAATVLASCAFSDPITAGTTGDGGGSSTDVASGGGSGDSTTSSTEVGGNASVGGGGGASTTASGSFCGDSVVDVGEECDDGNTQVGDGCDACEIECDVLGKKSPTNGHCYRLFPTMTGWTDAEAQCAAWGGAPNLGHLTSIENATEQNFVSAMVTDRTWIGATDAVTEGTYVWVDGTPFNYVFWAAGKPDGLDVQNCAFMLPTAEWDDHECDTPYQYLCERRGAGTF